MAITIGCPGCRATLQLPDEAGGGQGQCPYCQTVFQVPRRQPAFMVPARDEAPPPLPQTYLMEAVQSRSSPVEKGRRVTAKAPVKPPTSGRGKKWAAAFVILLMFAGAGAAAWWWFYIRPGNLPDDVKYLPDNCQFITFVDVELLIRTGAYDKLKASGEMGDIEKTLQTRLGIHLKNIRSVALGGNFGNADSVVFVIQPDTMPQPKLIYDRLKVAFRETSQGNYTIHEGAEDAFCIVNDKTLVLGRTAKLRAIFERDKSPALSDALRSALKHLDRSKTVAVAVDLENTRGTMDDPINLHGQDGLRFLKATSWATMEMEWGVEIATKTTWSPRGETTADALLQQIKEEAKELADDNSDFPDVAAVLKSFRKSLQIEQDQVQARLSISAKRLLLPLLAVAKPVNYWVQVLQDSSNPRFGVAVKRLQSLGASALPRLRRLLLHKNAATRAKADAITLVAHLGPSGIEAIPELAEVLQNDRSVKVREIAAKTLGEMGPPAKAKEALLSLILAQGEANQAVARAALRALIKLRPYAKQDVFALHAALQHSRISSLGKSFVLIELGKIGSAAKETVPDVAKCLKASNRSVRRYAAQTLGRIGKEARSAVSPIVVALYTAWKVKDSAVSVACINALEDLSPQAKVAIPFLRELALGANENAQIKMASREMLIRLTALQPADLDMLRGFLVDQPPIVQRCAIRSLAELKTAASEAVPDLCAVLKNTKNEMTVRRVTALALPIIGSKSKETAEALARAVLKDPSEIVRLAAAHSLGFIDNAPKEVINSQGEALADSKFSLAIRSQVIKNLIALGRHARSESGERWREVLSVLTKAATSDVHEEKIRLEALQALAAIQSLTFRVVEDLAKVLHNKNTPMTIRAQVLKTLASARNQTGPAVDELIKALADEDIRTHALASLETMGPLAKRAAEPLGKMLPAEKTAARTMQILRVLGALGPNAEPAVSHLLHCFRHNDKDVRDETVRTLAKLGKAAVPHLIKKLEPFAKMPVNTQPEYLTYAGCIYTLNLLGPIASDALPVLRDVLKKETDATRRAGIQQLIDRIVGK